MAAKVVVSAHPPPQHVLVTGVPGVGKTTLVCRVCKLLRERCGLSVVQGFYTQEVREKAGGHGHGRRIGFDVVTFDGKRCPLARIDSADSSFPASSTKSPHVGKYCVNLASFESLALPALQISPTPLSAVAPKGGGAAAEVDVSERRSGAASAGRGCLRKKLLVIDEIGKMELFSRAFVERVKNLFETPPGNSHSPTTPGSEGMEHGGVVILATIPIQRAQQKQHWLLESIRRRKDCLLFEVSEKNREHLVDEIVALLLDRIT